MRIKIFSAILIVCLTFLLSGLGFVQIGMHERYRTMSEENRLKIVPLTPPRGSIFDANGNTMVKDVLCFNVSVIYSRINDMNSLTEMLSGVLALEKDVISKKIKQSRSTPYSPVCIDPNVSIEKAVILEEIVDDYPGLMLEVSSRREYIFHEDAANMLGYLGMINRPEFERLRHYGYSINDLVGRDGVEKSYDEYLRGRYGGKQIEVDNRGREVSTLGFKEAVPGRDVYLTVNLELQKKCEELLEDKRGAIIAMDPRDGAVIAMASSPSFDPEAFVDPRRYKYVNERLRDKTYPLINRAVSGAYPPGSVFKVVVALGALEKGAVTKDTVFECQGQLRLGKAVFRCWKKGGHGAQTMKEAIKNSCNVYFFKTGLLTGPEKIKETSKMLGLGRKTEIDVPGEISGLLPGPAWKKEKYKENWYKGDTVNYSIGQGFVLCSPLQIVRMMSVFANRGNLVKPYLVRNIGDVVISRGQSENLGFDPAFVEIVRDGLRKVVNDKRGTGMKARLKDVVVSGKTGTAQTSRGKSHGWFAGFAPFEDPRLTVVVFDEYGGKGGYYAAGTAGEVFSKAKEIGLLQDEEKIR